MGHTAHTWSTGDTITAALLNTIENDLAAAAASTDLTTAINNVTTNYQAAIATANGTVTTNYQAADAVTLSAARSGVLLHTDIPVLDRGHGIANAEETFSRSAISGNFNLPSGSLSLAYFTARENRTVSTVEVWSSGTSVSPTPTLAKLGLYSVDGSGNLALLSGTASDTSLFGANNAQYARSLLTATSITSGSRYAIAMLQVGGTTTAGKVQASTAPAALLFRAPTMAAVLAAQTDLPSTITVGSLASLAGMAYAAVY